MGRRRIRGGGGGRGGILAFKGYLVKHKSIELLASLICHAKWLEYAQKVWN